ncbi:hypothetical protein BGW38_008337 [Lunasporangiospora selenospora]|uniref:Uncharacterized protein n=1 Tax=Lunasporangiospora selenospora TaxID=979761 RepID=A0A9P6FKC6_9FUNG|nr:hypothetical protein BGW38_008337 [Lunasporangiospora selenospora]
MIYTCSILQAAPSLYLQRIRQLRRISGTGIPTAVSAPPQLQLTPPFQQQSNQVSPLSDNHLDEMEDYGVETVGLDDPLPEQLDATEVCEGLAQVTLGDTPQLPLQVQSAPPSESTLSLEERLDMLATEVAESRCIIEFDVSNGFKYGMASRSRPFEEHWEEWFYGLIRDGVRSIG